MPTIKRGSKQLIVTTVIFAIVVAFLCSGFVIATSRPVINIDNISNCKQGDTISFSVSISGNNLINGGNIPFDTSYVVLHGFSAIVSITKNRYDKYTVVLNNVRGNESGNYVEIKSGAAIANDGLGAAYSSNAYSNSFNIASSDTVAPSISIIGPNVSSINNGGTITYIVRYTDASGVTSVNLYKNSVKLNGFTANVSISGSGENAKVVERKITLTNIQGTNGSKYITIVAATASDYNSNRTKATNSSPFNLKNRASSSSSSSSGNVSENSQSSESSQQEVTEESSDKPADWVENPNTGKY